jgi:RND family efflux transporter MFP subunit
LGILRLRRALALASLLLAAAGCAKKAPAPDPAPVVITASPLQKQVYDWDDYSGRFEAVDSVEVRPRVSGLLESQHFNDGQLVRKGQLLFVIDPRPYAAALAQAKAQTARARAGLTNAEAELKRAQALLVSSTISKSQSDLRAAAQQQALADLDAAQANEEAASLNLSFTRVIAPVSGRISFHRLAAGNLVTAQTSLLTTIMSQDPVYFVFDAPEAEFLKYQREAGRAHANEVRIKLQDEPDYRWKGRIDFLDNAVDRGSGTIRGRALVPNPGGFLTPGLFGQMRLMASHPTDALLIPDTAVVTDQTRQVVYVVGPGEVVSQRPVEPGRLIDGLRVIRSGLSPADRVVISGVQRARPGRKVSAKPGIITPFPSGVSVGENGRMVTPQGGPR